VAAANALARHLVLVGFMGAGKSTIGEEVARRLGRPFVDVDRAVESAHGDIGELFATQGEAAFRELEATFVRDSLATRVPAVVAVGGGAVETRGLLQDLDARVVHLSVDVDAAWERVQGSPRPLAQDEAAFRERFERRAPLYDDVADARADDPDGVVLAAAGIRFAAHVEARGDAVVADPAVVRLHGIDGAHSVREKTVDEAERLWSALELDRGSSLVAVGGGTTTDLAGFVAATYMRGIDWVAVPSTLVGQVDAAIGGKVGVDLPDGKNLVGAFHWPVETVIDTSLLGTLPDAERTNGLAEVVKTGLLAGEPLWELPTDVLVRRCASFKAAVCLGDPYDRGERAQLNLGHTFAHALEVASGYTVPHGRAVGLGLLAALRLSGLEDETRIVEDVLAPVPVEVDREVAWSALARDKKALDGQIRLVLLDGPGAPKVTADADPARVRSELDALIA
jgi:shikimate kinase/3-dehydroquinate synthase